MKKYIILSVIFIGVTAFVLSGSTMPLLLTIGYSIIWGIGLGCLAASMVDGIIQMVAHYREVCEEERKQEEMRSKINPYFPDTYDEELGL